jgi:DUF1016 N-terminal domain
VSLVPADNILPLQRVSDSIHWPMRPMTSGCGWLHYIVERQRAQGRGRSVVERLAADIQKGFPGMAGFSPQNIWKMRGFFLAWTAEVRNLSQAVRESRRDKFLSQLAREIDGEHLPRGAAEIPWGHNMVLIFKLDRIRRLLSSG